jgi:hypothetical protein
MNPPNNPVPPRQPSANNPSRPANTDSRGRPVPPKDPAIVINQGNIDDAEHFHQLARREGREPLLSNGSTNLSDPPHGYRYVSNGSTNTLVEDPNYSYDDQRRSDQLSNGTSNVHVLGSAPVPPLD